MKKIDKKSRPEQIFLLVLLSVACFGVFALTGCGGSQSCESVKCNSMKDDGFHAEGISVPGCGGCLGCGKGCNSCLWAQSCKFVSYGNTVDEENKLKIGGCDVVYYGSDCLGCSYDRKNCYAGYTQKTIDNDTTTELFYGDTEQGSHVLRFGGGQNGCVNGTSEQFNSIEGTENLLEIR